MMVEAQPLKPEDVEKSYDFFHKRQLLRAHRHDLADQAERAARGAASSLATCRASFDVERFVLPGVTQLSD